MNHKQAVARRKELEAKSATITGTGWPMVDLDFEIRNMLNEWSGGRGYDKARATKALDEYEAEIDNWIKNWNVK